MRDLIRRDMARKDQEAFERLKAELNHAVAEPDTAYQQLTAADVIARNLEFFGESPSSEN